MSSLPYTALITGASSGIGFELARIHAKNGDDLVLVARNETKLNDLKAELENEFKIKILVIVKDLSLPSAAMDVFHEIKRNSIRIDYLINNAGFGDCGFFVETDWEKEQRMIQLNITTLTHFTKLFAQEMIKNGNGKIMNVASTAAFQAGPTMSVYFATKAFVLSFSEAIQNELIEKGITVTALCPGATITGFKDAAAMQNSKLFDNKNLPNARQVAEFGYKAMIRGDAIAIHGVLNSFLVNSIRFFPRKLVNKITRMIIGK